MTSSAPYNVFCISAGHAPAGGIGSGAVGYHDESKQARIITKEVVSLINNHGAKAYNCTCDVSCTQQVCLDKIVASHNGHKEKHLDVSVHLNCYKQDQGDGETKGIEIYVYAEDGDQEKIAAAKRIMSKFKAAGFTVRGIKAKKNLRFLAETKMPAILVELYFCDDKDDTNLADELGTSALSRFVAEGLLDIDIEVTFAVKPGDTLVAKRELLIRSSYKGDYDKLGYIKAGTEMIVSKVNGNRAKVNGSGWWVNCSESCVSVKK